jgi:hypothetical protein
MKDNIRMIYHSNYEIKTEKTTFVSFTRRNFGDHEMYPGKKAYMKVHMEIVRDKEPMLNVMAKTVKRFFRKYWFSRL